MDLRMKLGLVLENFRVSSQMTVFSIYLEEMLYIHCFLLASLAPPTPEPPTREQKDGIFFLFNH